MTERNKPATINDVAANDEMAWLGTFKLLAQINGGADAGRTFETLVSPRFVPRESTGPAK